MPVARIAKTEKSQFSARKYIKSPETPRKIAKITPRGHRVKLQKPQMPIFVAQNAFLRLKAAQNFAHSEKPCIYGKTGGIRDIIRARRPSFGAARIVRTPI